MKLIIVKNVTLNLISSEAHKEDRHRNSNCAYLNLFLFTSVYFTVRRETNILKGLAMEHKEIG